MPSRRRAHSTIGTRPTWALVLLVALALHGNYGCASEREFSGVFIEELPDGALDEARNTAFRMTIYEFADSVGGFVEYYEIGGLNRRRSPYVVANSCAYFGPVRRLDRAVRFDVLAPNGVDTLRIELDDVSRNAISGRILVGAGTVDPDVATDESYALTFVADGPQRPAGVCPAPLPAASTPLDVDSRRGDR